MAFQSIPADRIVSVVPSAIGPGGTPLAMTTLLINPQSSPRIIGVREFGSADEVGNFFGLSSREHSFAQRYFLGYEGATKIPQTLWLVGDKDQAQGAILQSASFRGVHLDTIKQSGSLDLIVDGSLVSASIDLSGVTSFSDAASAINAAITGDGLACAFVASAQIFEITTVATGEVKTLSFGANDLAEVLRLREEDGALVENGHDDMDVSGLMKYALSYTQNFAVITHATEQTTDRKKEFAEWATLRRSRFMMVIQDTAGAALTPNNAASFGAWLKETEQDGTLPYYGELDKIAALCGGIAAVDFKRRNGRRNVMFMRQAGLGADVTSEEDFTALMSNGYTFYAAFATANDRFLFQTNGAVAGKFLWADEYVNQIYLNSQLQLALMNMLLAYGTVPYNDVGKSYHRAAVQDPINEMINFGGIGALLDPKALSEQQKSIINSMVGRDVIAELLNKGYVVNIETADAQTRGMRGSMPFTLIYTDAGSVQSINLASVTVL